MNEHDDKSNIPHINDEKFKIELPLPIQAIRKGILFYVLSAWGSIVFVIASFPNWPAWLVLFITSSIGISAGIGYARDSVLYDIAKIPVIIINILYIIGMILLIGIH